MQCIVVAGNLIVMLTYRYSQSACLVPTLPEKERSNGGGPESTSGGADEGKGGGGAGASSSLVSFPCVLSCSENIGLSCVFSLLSVLPPSELREGGLTFRLGLLLVA